ncbi:hypothetical protein SLE2022_080610 [Rubroshorea leprosula]
MGYHPQMGSQPEQYPPNYYHNGYNQCAYAQPPPASYYYQQNYTNDRRATEFIRGFLCVIFFFIFLVCILSITTWIILHPEIPTFHVESMSVSNFNTSTPFTANFNATIVVDNSNKKMRIYFDRIQSSVYYDDSNPVGFAYSTPLYLEKGTKTTMGVQISTNGSVEQSVPIWVVQEMEKERNTRGSVTFSLRFSIWSTFKSGTWWMRHMSMRVFCGDLKVDFGAGSGTGNLAAEKRDNCWIYV